MRSWVQIAVPGNGRGLTLNESSSERNTAQGSPRGQGVRAPGPPCPLQDTLLSSPKSKGCQVHCIIIVDKHTLLSPEQATWTWAATSARAGLDDAWTVKTEGSLRWSGSAFVR